MLLWSFLPDCPLSLQSHWDRGQNWVSSLARCDLINVLLLHSSSWASVLFIFFKVPLSLLTSARLLISLFYLSLAAVDHLSTLKSIVEDWEGECLPWPALSQSLSSSHPLLPHIHTHKVTPKHTHTHTKWMTLSTHCTTPLIPAAILINLEVPQGQDRTVCMSAVGWCCQIKI